MTLHSRFKLKAPADLRYGVLRRRPRLPRLGWVFMTLTAAILLAPCFHLLYRHVTGQDNVNVASLPAFDFETGNNQSVSLVKSISTQNAWTATNTGFRRGARDLIHIDAPYYKNFTTTYSSSSSTSQPEIEMKDLTNTLVPVVHSVIRDDAWSLLGERSSFDMRAFSAPFAPRFRGASVGGLWTLQSSMTGLEAPGMNCECFNPSASCCMPTNTSMPPFCITGNTSCCDNTYCEASEVCCKDACCTAGTDCVITDSGPGCCPVGALCSGAPDCLDYGSPECGQATASVGCCSEDLPLCINASGVGYACYASTPPGYQTTFSSVAQPAPAGTGMSPAAQSASPTTITQNDTLTLLPVLLSGYTYILPSGPVWTSTQGSYEVVTTLWIIDVLPSPSLTASKTPSAPTSTNNPNPMTTLDASESIDVTPGTSPTTTASLCFNSILLIDGPCGKSATAYDYEPPGITIIDGPPILGMASRKKKEASTLAVVLLCFLVTFTLAV